MSKSQATNIKDIAKEKQENIEHPKTTATTTVSSSTTMHPQHQPTETLTSSHQPSTNISQRPEELRRAEVSEQGQQNITQLPQQQGQQYQQYAQQQQPPFSQSQFSEQQPLHQQLPPQQRVHIPSGQQTTTQLLPGQAQTQSTTVTMTTTTQAPHIRGEQSVLGGVGGIGYQQENEPTINLFNRFVAKDTHCLLGRTGVKISRICLGTMNFGEISAQFGDRPGQLDESKAHTILDRYLELGGNCIDTADFFPWFGPDAGRTETIIGNWLAKQDREKIFLITKVRMPMEMDNINSIGLSRLHLIESVNNSLKRLQTSWIDMLVLNGWDNSVSFGDTVRNLDDLVRTNRIHYVGISDVKGWQLQKFIDCAKIMNLNRCVCYVGEYNLLTRGCEWEVLDVCKNERIGFIAYAPTKYGFLTNETAESGMQGPVAGSRIACCRANNLAAMGESFNALRRNPVNLNVLQYCNLLSRKYRVSVAQIAIQWLLQTGVVTAVCVGVEDVQELEQNMSCLVGDFVLSQEDMLELNFVSSVPLHYPYHTQLAEIAGFRKIQPISNRTEFEQLSVRLTSDAPELNLNTDVNMNRLNLKETCHESLNQALPERDFLRYMQMKTVPQFQQQLTQQQPMVQMSGGYEQPHGIQGQRMI